MTEDIFDRIFELQKALDSEILDKEIERRLAKPKRYTADMDERVSRLCTAIIHECVELQRLTSWKWWKVPVEFDHRAVREEYVDIIHFVVSLGLTLGMTPSDILEEYEKKNKINHERQEQGY